MNKILEKNISIKCEILKIRSENNNNYILQITRDEEILNKYKYKFNSDYFICKGTSPYNLVVGDQIEIIGDIIDNKDKSPIEFYQFIFSNIEKSYINSKQGFINYLCTFDGIGPGKAKKIVLLYSNDIQKSIVNFNKDILENNPIVMKLLNKKQQTNCLNKISSNEENNLNLSETEKSFIFEMEIKPGLVKKIKTHNKKNNLVTIFETNPYEQALHIKGVGFKKIEKDALRIKDKLLINSDVFEKSRLSIAIFYILQKASDNGHSFLRKLGIYTLLEKELNIYDLDEDLVEECLVFLIEKKAIVLEDFDILTREKLEEKHFRYYLAQHHFNEENIARIIKERIEYDKKKTLNIDVNNFDFSNFNLADRQEEAIITSTKYNTFILTGGPGTGKTFTSQLIFNKLKEINPNWKINIMAPTGSAAKRISQVVGFPASTIHRGFKLKGSFSEFNHNFDCDILLIDEASMINNEIANIILKSIKFSTKVIFIGDVDQLESVGVGNFLEDLIEAGVPSVKLNKIFRQAKNSQITTFAYDVNSGNTKTYREYTQTQHCDYSKELNILIKKSYNKKQNEFYSDNMEKDIIEEGVKMYERNGLLDAQILLPIRNGGKGSGNAVNKKLQDILNDNNFIDEDFFDGDWKKQRFKVGDKVMQKRNNYKKEVFNGTLGIIKSYDKKTKKVIIEFVDGSENILIDYFIEKKGLSLDEDISKNIDLSYTLTIHKSQGQEYKEILLGLNSYMFVNRKILYTGITRARNKEIIITNDVNILNGITSEGHKETINKKLYTIKRNSSLKERILNILSF